MTTKPPEIAGWRLSTWCTRDDHDNCVEVGRGPGIVGVRDTKEHGQPNQQAIVVGDATFAAFLRHLVA